MYLSIAVSGSWQWSTSVSAGVQKKATHGLQTGHESSSLPSSLSRPLQIIHNMALNQFRAAHQLLVMSLSHTYEPFLTHLWLSLPLLSSFMPSLSQTSFMMLYIAIFSYESEIITVEPLKRGQFGSRGFVLCSEVVPISEVHHFIAFLLHIQ